MSHEEIEIYMKLNWELYWERILMTYPLGFVLNESHSPSKHLFFDYPYVIIMKLPQYVYLYPPNAESFSLAIGRHKSEMRENMCLYKVQFNWLRNGIKCLTIKIFFSLFCFKNFGIFSFSIHTFLLSLLKLGVFLFITQYDLFVNSIVVFTLPRVKENETT